MRQSLQFLESTMGMEWIRWVTDTDNDEHNDNDDRKVGHCPPAVRYNPWYWWTRYPPEISKFWNLTKLFSPESWRWTFLTLLLITISLKFSTSVGSYLGMRSGTEEVTLIPFRWLLNIWSKSIKSIIFRVSSINHEHFNQFFQRGFSFHTIFLSWAVFGGFIT